MRGYYTIAIRRAANGALRMLNFHNHIQPGFYELLLNKTVNDNRNSVIDTVYLSDTSGVVSEEYDESLSFVSNIKYSRHYTEYFTPTNIVATNPNLEFHHIFEFKDIVTEVINVNEVGVGSDLDERVVLASKALIRDVNGEPITVTLFPGDEITITWNFLISKPLPMSRTNDDTQTYFIKSTLASPIVTDQTIDYVMFAANPNWHVMGIKRIMQLILEQNSLMTNTVWKYQLRSTSGDYTDRQPQTIQEFKDGFVLRTDMNDANAIVPDRVYIPNLFAPTQVPWNYTANRVQIIGVKSTIEDLYQRWVTSIEMPFSERKIPKKIDFVDVVLNMVPEKAYSSSSAPYVPIYYVDIYTTPYALITLYLGGRIQHRGMANGYGHYNYRIGQINDLERELMVRAHIRDHQLVQSYKFTPMTERDNLLTDGGVGKGQYDDKGYVQVVYVGTRDLTKTYRASLVTELVEPKPGEPDRGDVYINNNYTMGLTPHVYQIVGDLRIGDKYHVRLIDEESGEIAYTFTKTLYSLAVGHWSDLGEEPDRNGRLTALASITLL